MTPDNFVINNGVLATAHSIFKRWRSQFRSNKLFTEINFVLERFCKPHFELFKHVDSLLSSTQPLPPNASLPLLAQSLLLLIQLFNDLSSQDLPPFFEENLGSFMGDDTQQGWLLKYLSWERPELKGDVSPFIYIADRCRMMTRHQDHCKRSGLLFARSPSYTHKSTLRTSLNWATLSMAFGKCLPLLALALARML